jgi:ADP-dependent NAD(P)H-hydrate dehydratase / NAD(P)H-hydrate epimerase
MHILTSASMREADRRTIREVGIPASVLMESAGRAVVRAMVERIEDLSTRSIVVSAQRIGNSFLACAAARALWRLCGGRVLAQLG